MNKLILISNLILALLGIVMIGLGIRSSILPPTVTGVGFLLIALVQQLNNRES